MIDNTNIQGTKNQSEKQNERVVPNSGFFVYYNFISNFT
jgi:hypothetical protein